MHKKYRDPERERRRLATIRRNKGKDFFEKNGKHASQFNRTKFNSRTGRAAALRKHEIDREKKAKQIKLAEEKRNESR